MNMKELWKKITGSREASLVVVLVILCLFIQSRNHTFFTPDMIESLFKNYAFDFIMAAGMMLVLLIGGIDISIGATLAFSGMAASLYLRDHQETPVLVVFLISTVIGLLCGVLIGVIIAYGKVHPIICTLGFMSIYRGLTYLIAKNEWVAASQFTDSFKEFAQSRYLGFGMINNLVVIVIVIYIIFYIIMKWTPAGRKVYAVGSNADAALVSGIRVKYVKLACYSLLGALCGLAGAMYTSLYASSQGNMAEGIEMDVIAACVVGGVSLTGGRGSIVGVFLGTLIISIIGKGLPLIGVSQFWQAAIKGLIILIAVIINVIVQRQMNKVALKKREV